jgi:hypothetical protein
MSFRDRHRFLDGIYNSYPDPALITAEDMGEVAGKIGLLMEEVLAWFKDEKLRRAKLLANTQHQAQVSKCQFPSSPESIRASGEVSSTSSLYNSASPGTPSQPLNGFSPCPTSIDDKKMLAPPKTKRGRPAKTQMKTEPDLPSPDAKRKKISMEYPCPDCGSLVPSERYVEHINRRHFPENVWECPKTNKQTGKPCSSNPHYRPSYRHDNFAKHLQHEHHCSNSEIVELKKICKLEVFDFFHKICGFCDKSLGSRDESIEHIKEHFKQISQKPNPPADLGVSLWKDKCGFEHKLQLGIHYRRSGVSNQDLSNVDLDNDRNGHEGEDGGSGKGNSDNSGHDGSDSQPDNNTHDRGNDESRHSGEGSSDSQGCENPDSQSSESNHNRDHDHSEDGLSGETNSVVSSSPKLMTPTFCKDRHSQGWSKTQNLTAVSSILTPNCDRRSESQERASSRSPQRMLTVPRPWTPRFTSKEDANSQPHAKGYAELSSRCHNFKYHVQNHDAICRYLCTAKGCDKTFAREPDLQRHRRKAHDMQLNHRCVYCGLLFDPHTLKR